jgi:AcrR family transcriptional regulator
VVHGYEITPRKRPTQARAMPTFDALVEACSRLLPDLGYEKLTTQAIAERAGVGIGSLYEYFPGKDAIIAVVVERMVERVMTKLGDDLRAILEQAGSVEIWITRIYETIEAERALIAVLLEQVPYTRQLDVIRELPDRLLTFSEQGRQAAGIALPRPTAALTLINNLVSTTVLQIVLAPPAGATKAEVIAMLTSQVRSMLGSSNS